MSLDLLMTRGWLHKKKSKSSVLGSDANRRWFVIEKVKPKAEIDGHEDRFEYTLSYYKNPTCTQRCGWFFLTDVRTILTDDVSRWITIQLHSRTYQLRTPDHRQHDAWCHSLESLCSNLSPHLFGRCTAPSQYASAPFSVTPTRLSLSTNQDMDDKISTKQNYIRNELEF
jgi:hypothetical protein